MAEALGRDVQASKYSPSMDLHAPCSRPMSPPRAWPSCTPEPPDGCCRSGSRGSRLPSDRVAGWFGGVGRPDGVVHRKVPSGSWSTFHLRCCLTRWSRQTLRSGVTQARSSARLKGDVVLEVAGGGRSPADGAGAGGVPDLGQVAELDAGVVALGLKPVVAVLGGDGCRPTTRSGPVPGSAGSRCRSRLAARRGWLAGVNANPGLPRFLRDPGRPRFPCLPGPGGGSWARAGAAVADGVAFGVGDGYAPFRPGALAAAARARSRASTRFYRPEAGEVSRAGQPGPAWWPAGRSGSPVRGEPHLQPVRPGARLVWPGSRALESVPGGGPPPPF